ncbi:MAG: hypothetical protein Kow0025_02600 [Thermodesulfovibrionales bacterium]
MALSIFMLLCLAAPVAAGDGPGVEAARLRAENERISAELKLAGKPGIYFVFDLGEEHIDIKARGATLKKISIISVETWGDAPPRAPLALLGKSAMSRPKRKEIKPGETKNGGGFELEALEASDMPASYKLRLEGGVEILVRPEPGSAASRALASGRRLAWWATRPAFAAYRHLAGQRPYTSVYLTLAEGDARALFWALGEGSRCLVAR